jgi:hypothetical protein
MKIIYCFYKYRPIVYTHNECHEKCWRSKLHDHCKNILIQLNSKYTKSNFNILFKFTLVNTSFAIKYDLIVLKKIQIHAKDLK